MPKIYLDHSATTPVDKAVLNKMLPYFSEKFGNPSSMHSFGQEALAGVDIAREQAAKFLHCEPGDIYFTSGATESNNLAIKGYFKSLLAQGKEYSDFHAITSLVEHDAVLEPFREIEKSGLNVSRIPVKANGVVDIGKFKKELSDKTVFVSIMWVNSEVGAIMPIKEIGKTIRKINERREKDWKNSDPKTRGTKSLPIVFHVDATQAANFINCDVKWNYIDMLSMSAHKIYGPKGVGLLYKNDNIKIAALQRGGHQEKNLRSGTINAAGIVGMGAAIEQSGVGEKGEPSKEQIKTNKYIASLRDRLVNGIIKKISDIILNTDRDVSAPSHAHFSFIGVEGESLLMSLDLEGIAVSTGSACASGSLKSSHVLLAMGIDKEVSHYSVRFTVGKHNTKEEIDRVLKILPPIVERLRRMNPIYKK
jgi:cysteine desulfurase